VGAHFEAERIIPRGSILGRAGGRDDAARRAAVRVVLWSLIGLCGLALVLQLAFHFVVSPRLTVRHVVVRGDSILTAEEAASAAGLSMGGSLLAVNTTRVRASLEGLPAVRRAAVAKELPDTLVITIEARRPLAKALVPTPEGTVPVLIDGEGLIFAAGADAAGQDLPIISGLGFVRWQPGTRLPAVLRPLLDDLRKLQTDEPALFAFISEVMVKPAGARDLDIMIYPAAYATPIRAGGRIPADLLKNAALLLDVIRRERLEDRVVEVDMRAREVVYRERSGG
jgi:hypothetical protein